MLFYSAMLAYGIFSIASSDASEPRLMRAVPWVLCILCVMGLAFEITDNMVK